MEIRFADQLADLCVCVALGCGIAILLKSLDYFGKIINARWLLPAAQMAASAVFLVAMLLTVWRAGGGLLREFMIVGAGLGFAATCYLAERQLNALVEKTARRRRLRVARKSERK